MGRLLPADIALEFSAEYSAVVVFGQAAVIGNHEEAERVLQLLLDKYFPHLQSGRDYRPITEEEIARTAVMRISISHWSAKQNLEIPDFPGAFEYPHEFARKL
jgi:nitroimidazol reductase NimA-like FMN-containing flavoprotein (pyridoxamine 5'-phosphate oxidase superfamily)